MRRRGPVRYTGRLKKSRAVVRISSGRDRVLKSVLVLGLLAACCPGAGSEAAADEPTNLAPNPGFEMPDSTNPTLPDGWNIFAINGTADMQLSNKEVFEGERSLRVRMLPEPGAVQGVLVHVQVDPKALYSFRIHGKRDRDIISAGAGSFRLVVEWINEAREEIKRDQTADIPLSRLSRLRWREFELEKLKPPKGAATAKFGIHFFSTGPGKAVIYLDGAEITAR